MHDHELIEFSAGVRSSETKKAEGESVAGVSDAIRTGRPDALGPKGMLHLQRAAGNAGVSALVQRQEEESPVHEVIRGPGQPLPEQTRTFMEERMGQDFSDVRVHTDSKAAESAKSVQAQAYTVGNNIVFNEGKFDPESDSGKHTLAHELTHVVQQRSGPVSGTPQAGGINVSDPSDSFEQAAESNAKSVLSDNAPVATAGATAQTMPLQRQGEEEEEVAQTMPLQRQGEEEAQEEEVAQTMPLQRQGEEEAQEEEVAQTMPLQRQGEEEEKLEDDTPTGAPTAQGTFIQREEGEEVEE